MPEEKRVAVRYYQTIPKHVRIGEETYIFSVRHNISLCWVKPEHVDRMLDKKKSCCGGNKRRVFSLADEVHIRRHQFGGR